MSRRGPIIAAVVFAILAILAVVLLVMPKMREVGRTRDQLATAQAQETSLRTELASLREAQAQAPQTKAEIAKLGNQVPPTADLPGLIRLLTAAADGSAVDFFTFTPGSPTVNPSSTFSTISSSISVTGGYFALDEFLYRLETLPRAAKVTAVSISPGGGATGGPSTLTMQLTVEFFTTDTSAGPGSQPGPSATTPGA